MNTKPFPIYTLSLFVVIVFASFYGWYHYPGHPANPHEWLNDEHIRFTQKTVPAAENGPAYSSQVIVQTDIVSQPTALRIEADKNLADARFFIAGQPVTMNVRTVINGKFFILGFSYPAFTPENPIVITLLSNEGPIQIIKVGKLDGF